MNRVFKVIWSHARNAYVVVSEIALNHGKNTKGSIGAAHLKKTLIAALLVSGTFGGVLYGGIDSYAADPVNLDNGASAYYDANGNLTIGKNVQAEGKNKTGSKNTVIGTDSDTIRDDGTGKGQALDDTSNEKLVDGEGQAHDLNRSTESSGDNDQGSTAVGYDSHAEGDASTAIGNKAKVLDKPTTYYADAEGNKTTSVDDAAWYADSNGKPTKVPQVFRDADNKTTTTPQYIHTYQEKDAATGQMVTKTEITTDATKADKNTDGSLKYNYQKADNKLYSVTLYQPSSNSIAAGSEVEADGENAVAVGYKSTAQSSAVAIGDNAKAEKDTVAIGKEANASAEGGVALGMGSTADRSGGVTGWDPKTGNTSGETTAVWKSGNGAISVGNGEGSRQITNVAAGSEDSDAVNLAQLKKAMIHYYSVKTTEATDQAGNNNYLNDGATGDNALAAGVRALAFGDNSTAVGTDSQAQGQNSAAYGYGAIAFKEDSTAMGSNAQAQARSSTAYGSSAIAKGSGSTVIGYGATSQGEESVAIGGHALGNYSVQVGTGSTSQGISSVAVGGHATGDNSVVVGNNSTAQGEHSVSVGGHAIGTQSTAIGYGANSPGRSSIAVGGNTHNDNETAIGSGATTSGGQSVTVGGTATGSQSVSVGNNANATSQQATTVGFNTSATGSQSTALGYNSHASNSQSVAIGGSTANSNQAVAIGSGAAAGSYYNGYSGMTAVGQNSHANGNGSTALGNSANAGGQYTSAIGYGSNAYGSYTMAMGGASVNGTNSIAVGNSATAQDNSSIAFGSQSNVTSSFGTAIGVQTKTAYKGTAVGYGVQAGGSEATAIGVGSMASGANATAIGGGGAWQANSVAIGSDAGTNTNAVAIGKGSKAWGDSAVSLGINSEATGANATAIGGGKAYQQDGVAIGSNAGTNKSAVSIGKNSNAWGENGVSLGTNSSATGLNSTAIGGGKAYSDEAIAIGSNAQTNKAITIGKNSSAWGDSAVAIGENASAWRTNSIVLGKNSESGADKNIQGFDPITGKASKDASATWNSTDEAVSFGRAEERDEQGNVTKTAITRQLNNVAAGTQDTDAVNVAQLKLAATKINMHYYSVHSTETGDGSNYANDGATGTNALAAGVSASASGDSALAIGTNASSKAQHSIAVGTQTTAEKDSAVAIGYDTHAVNDSTVAIGSGTQARGRYSVALGLSSVAGTETNDASNPLDGGGSVAIGYGAAAEATRSIAIGTAASAYENAFTTALGDSSIASQRGSVALGAGSNATRAAGNLEGGTEYKKAYLMPDTAAADDITWTSTEGAVSVGGTTKYIDYDESGKKVTKTKTITRQITNVAAGSEDTDAVNVAQLKAATIHDYSVNSVDPDTDTNYWNKGATGKNALAAGVSAAAQGENSTALGTNAYAQYDNSLALGGNASAVNAENTMAIGAGSNASSKGAMAIGNGAAATDKENALAIGNSANASSTRAIAIGYKAGATNADDALAIGTSAGVSGKSGTALGHEAYVAAGENGVAIGTKSGASGDNSIAIGTGAVATTNSRRGETIIGQSTAIGYKANASGTNDTAIGANVNVSGRYSVALGSDQTTVSGDRSAALGVGANVSGNSSVAAGDKANASGNRAVAIGAGTNATDTASIAIGNNSRSSNSATAIGDGALASGKNSLAIGRTLTANGMTRTTQSTGQDSMALGNGANAWGNGSIALGKLASAGEDSSGGWDISKNIGNAIAIGNEANAWSANAVALGHKSGAAANSIAMGSSSSAWKEHAMALGNNAAGAAEYGIALGEGATVANHYKQDASGNWVEDTDNPAIGAVAIGNDSLANVEGGVALGKGSKTVTARSDVDGYDVVTGKAFAGTNETPATSTTWHSTSGAVSVGDVDSGLTRRINGVAAGTEDTDAVNVAQLKRVKAAMDSVAGAHTEVTVNDKSKPTSAKAGDGTYGAYEGGETDNLHIAAMKGTDGKLTYNIKLNDQLSIGKNGKDGTDGKVTVDTKGGTTVIIGHDGKDGDNGKDGLFVRGDDGKDGKSGISITGPNGLDGKDGIDGTIGIAGKDGKDAVSLSGKDGVGHIGLTGPKGADGKDGTSIDLSTDYRTKTLNPDKNTTVNGEEKASRIVYKDAKGDHEVATMDDGLKFIGDDDTATPIAKKLNETLQIRGDGTYDATTKKVADDGNIKTSVADGAVKVSLSDKINLHQNGSLTLGGDANGTEKDGTDPITIRHFDDKTLDVITGVDKEGKPITSKEGKAGDYITGLDNKTWNNESYVSGRAATEDQLHQAVSNLIGPNANGGFGLSANGSEVKQALGKTITINGDGMYGTDGKETTAGNISTSVKDGAIKVSLNKNLNIDSTTMEGKDKDGNKVSNVTNAEGSTITKADTSGKQSSTTINAGSLTIKDGDGTTTIGGGSATIGGVTINGNGEKDGSDQHTSTITGLSNKTFDTNNTKQYENSGRAATEAQLKEVYDKASQHTTVTVNGNPTTDGNLKLDTTINQDGSKNYAISLNNDITLGDKDNNGKLTVQSKDGTKSITTNGEDGTLTFKDGSSTASMKAAGSEKGVDGTTDINRVAIDNHTVATMDDGMKFAGDSGEALKQKLNSTTNIKGGASGELSDGNIGVVSDGKDTLTVKLAKDIKGLNSVEAATINATTVNSSTFNAGNTTMDNSGVTIRTGDSGRTITIKDGGVSMGGNQIHNVAPGTAPDDAVNVSQLNATNGVVNKLGSRINKVGAGAAALAALHPLDFDPDDKWDVAAGYGHYKNADAAAIGAFYQPNEDTMLSIGGSFGGGENMVNAGVSVKLGQGNHVSTSRVAMAKEIRDLRENVAKLNDVVNRQSALIDKLTGVNAGTIQDRGNDLFPDVPANHWAYEYVTALHKAGILEGYPDGTFSGDRMMTRYEFAAIVYRAIMAGAASNPALNRDGTLDKLAKEFSSEMKYIRIDTISKDRNGNPDIQRVRVIPQKQEKK